MFAFSNIVFFGGKDMRAKEEFPNEKADCETK